MNKNNTSIYWFISSILVTILGAMSILLLFMVQFYQTQGVIFWSIVISWITILIIVAIMFCVQIDIQKRLRDQYADIIQNLQLTIEEYQNE